MWFFLFSFTVLIFLLYAYASQDGVHYHWSDRKHVSLSRWSEEDEDLVDDCVYLDSDGFWKTAECYSEKPGMICYLPGSMNPHLPLKINTYYRSGNVFVEMFKYLNKTILKN